MNTIQLVIVSGRSGSGKSVALRVLEDLGYYCVDNLPLHLLGALLDSIDSQQVAVSIDVRNLPEDTAMLERHLAALRQHGHLQLLYLDASDATLLRRYSETRRRHPLLAEAKTLSDAISTERERMAPLAALADHHIDSTDLSLHQLCDRVRERLLGRPESPLTLIFESFGFKYGLPIDADYVFDCRFLPNPHWEPQLKPLTGKDEPVREFFRAQPQVSQFIGQLEQLLQSWLPQLERNNRSSVTIAIGCTGGQHRSVYICEQLAEGCRRRGKQVRIRHREQD